MNKFDFNRLLALAALIVIVAIAALSNYRLEIGLSGLKFERNESHFEDVVDSAIAK